MGGDMGSNSSSSGEEDGDAEWRAAIHSVASTTPNRSTVANGNGKTTSSVASPTRGKQTDNKRIKLYHIKAQKLLDEIVEKSIQIVKLQPTEVAENHSINGGGVRLFRDAPPGILFDRVDEFQGPVKRPRLVPDVEVDEKSKKFRNQLKSVVVDGHDIIASAKETCERSLAKLEARDAAAKAKARKEDERVAELKRIRGERWLPAITRQMQFK